MDCVKTIIINSPASTSPPKKILSGKICIEQKSIEGHEAVKIAVAISRRERIRNLSDWLEIIRKPTSPAKSGGFAIDKEDWFRSGLLWTISTPIFETTKIKIQIDPSELLQSGFRVEIFSRDAVIIREVQPSDDLSTGATITFAINWTVNSNSTDATPEIQPLGISG